MTWIACYLPDAEAELVFAGRVRSAGALIENETVVGVTSKARASGVRPGMLLRTAFAFTPSLSVLKRPEPRLSAWLSVQRARLAPHAGRVRAAVGLFETGDALITAELLPESNDVSASFAEEPASLRIGFGSGEAEAVLAALSGRKSLSHEEARRLPLSDCLPGLPPAAPVTPDGLVCASPSSLTPAAAELRALLRGDCTLLKDVRLDGEFFLRMPIENSLPGSEIEHRLSETASALSGWLASRRMQPGRISLTIETDVSTDTFETSPASGTSAAIFVDLIRTLRRTPHAGIHAFTVRLVMQRLDDNPPAASGLAADLASRLGDGRVYRLSAADSGFPGAVRHAAREQTAVSERRALPERSAVPSMIRREAVPLREEKGVPLWEGPLTLQEGPSVRRIGSEVREYWTAKTTAGRRVWLWKTPGRKNWHLQGLFA